MNKMAEISIEVDEEKEEEDMPEMPETEEELAKLDGAPVETGVKFSAEKSKVNFGKKVVNPQAAFLSKLYK